MQIFGTRKCKQTQKAERFLKERGIDYQFVDLTQKAMSPRELDSVAASIGGHHLLMDEESKAFQKRGMAWMEYDPREELLEHPELLRTPIIRKQPKAMVGFDADQLQELIG
ncbi:arsenate reductase family protein [Spirochaeta africana]|uniref:Glutaredoxin family protein, arsenate reductase n=1 Tax=Spirochaeta africana (strain ATCC 700263 / DSM 8902 / Z-7692) TaxID=889378 RepID=H9UG15_SPIAZ|nr:ArsC/Spx/MgsR family protein [Spirochaeta africana]AFG36458.1 glutaredoxin family protein, arsenate reductase [Spirochaeta africana DSM 8902]